jgi:hypothetical protein
LIIVAPPEIDLGICGQRMGAATTDRPADARLPTSAQ